MHGGCNKLILQFKNGEFDQLLGDLVDDAEEKRISVIIEKESVSLSSELKTIAQDKCTDPLEESTLILASRIIANNEDLERKIIRVDNL